MKKLRILGCKALLIALGIGMVSGCGPKVDIRPEFNDSYLNKLAFLPVVYPSGIQKERVDYIRSTFAAELQSNGLVVLDDRLVSQTCSTPECPERAQLAEKYGVTGFVQLSVESISRNNFLAGYYNAIRGKLSLSDRNARNLLLVDHTESERGGLVFQSGQIIQGVISTVKNASAEESVNDLSAKFVRTMLSKFPLRKESSQENVYALSVDSVDVKETGPQLYEVCANATPHSLASLIINKKNTTLREAASGRYCGLYELTSLQSGGTSLTLEVRSAYGNVARRELDLGNVSPCNLKDRVQLALEKGRPGVKILCVAAEGSKGANGECSTGLERCIDSRFLVYRGSSKLGPFQKVATFNGDRWQDTVNNSKEKNAYYEVVSLSRKGVRSQPVSVSTEKSEEEGGKQ